MVLIQAILNSKIKPKKYEIDVMLNDGTRVHYSAVDMEIWKEKYFRITLNHHECVIIPMNEVTRIKEIDLKAKKKAEWG